MYTNPPVNLHFSDTEIAPIITILMLEQKLCPYGFRADGKAIRFSVCKHSQMPNLAFHGHPFSCFMLKS